MTKTKAQKIDSYIEQASCYEEMYRRHKPNKKFYSGAQRKTMQKLLTRRNKMMKKVAKLERVQ